MILVPRQIREKIGEVHRVRTVKTFGDHVKEVAQIAGGIVVIIVIIGIIVG